MSPQPRKVEQVEGACASLAFAHFAGAMRFRGAAPSCADHGAALPDLAAHCLQGIQVSSGASRTTGMPGGPFFVGSAPHAKADQAESARIADVSPHIHAHPARMLLPERVENALEIAWFWRSLFNQSWLIDASTRQGRPPGDASEQ